MRNFVLLVLMMAFGAKIEAQNIVYDENAEVRTVGQFNGIEVSGAVFLYVSQGTTQGVAVSAGDAKYNNKIKTEVKNGLLHISVEGGIWNGFNWTNRKLRAYVTVTDLRRLNVSGASYVSVSGTLKSDELKMEISGASEVKGIVNVAKIDIDMSGASVAKLTGTANSGTIDASGACKIDSYDLVFDRCSISSSGASDIRVTINGEINVDASGGSTIRYKGTGVGKSLHTSGGASIKSRSGNDD